MCSKHEYFRFLSQTNSALKIISAIRVPNLVKIGKKIVPGSVDAVDERENFVIAEVCAAHAH